MLKACPAIELFLVNPWPEGVSDQLAVHPGELARFLESLPLQRLGAHRTGSTGTPLERIGRSSIGESPVELAWIGPARRSTWCGSWQPVLPREAWRWVRLAETATRRSIACGK